MGAIAIDEPTREQALMLTEGVALHALVLLDYELASIARTKIVREPNRRDELVACLVDALGTNIQRHDVTYDAVVHLSLQTGLTTYDASYLWLARYLAVPLATLDERPRRAAEV